MGLFDQIAGGLKNALSGGSQGGLVDSIQHLLTSSETGGLDGLVQKFKEKGLGDIMSSWISTGENKAISKDQIQQVLGSGFLQQLAQKAGISADTFSQQLTGMLPQVIDKLTPNGKLPESGKLAEGLSMLKDQFLKKG